MTNSSSTGVTGDSRGAPQDPRPGCGADRIPTDSGVVVVDASAMVSTHYAWACEGPDEVYVAGGEPDERFDTDDAEQLAAATLAAVRVARNGHDRPLSPESQSLTIDDHRVVLPPPDPSDSDEDLCGYVFFGRGAAAAFPGDDRVHVMAIGGEATSADDAEVWALSILAAVRAARRTGVAQ